MGNYVVRWEVEAPDFDSPEQAALFAEERMQDPLGQRPPVFKVLDTDTGVTKARPSSYLAAEVDRGTALAGLPATCGSWNSARFATVASTTPSHVDRALYARSVWTASGFLSE
jgi:hypothetical protein